MKKMDWNEFVDMHKTGHGVGIRSFLKLKPFDANGKKPAPVRSVLLKTVAAIATDDWSVTSLPCKAKSGTKTISGTAYHFIFKSAGDQSAAMQAIGALAHQTATTPQKPFATYKHLGDLMPAGYEQMAKAPSKP
ncbi:hypothetical protein JQK15_22425 [Sphingobium sp. BHU LFT2]|uniref:hypothetical protein n=1 Tax=Sphingobium sp. BHU LFT2 TaxID=2807634 RepID=UPI001BE54D0F|nr:hypothetical protein [Sphingobium sp. BHU LFT2]MBT2246265.1 hypothetical protein [Sphingobium sp. BHU LFT2]